MLDAAIAAFVSDLSERELDTPLRALLRAEEFVNIAFVHGAAELGRDFIAQRGAKDAGELRQFNVQSKAGDLGLPDWRKVREQLEDIRTAPLAHPLYDRTLPGTIVLVTTGELTGQAPATAEGYGDTLEGSWEFELWDGERLIALVKNHLATALGERAHGPILSLLGSIDEGTVDLPAVELHSRRWIPEPGTAVAPTEILEASLIANRLKQAERLDLACVCALGLLRAQLCALADAVRPTDEEAAALDAAGRFFVGYATALWERCDESLLEPRALIQSDPGGGFWATYPVRCLRLAEILSLLALWQRRAGHDAAPVTDFVSGFTAGHPGCAHPISDRHAVSLLAPAVLLAEHDDLLTIWLRDTIRWTADRYEGESLGLASIEASPEDEIEYLLGDLEHVTQPRRRHSLIAGVVLDLAAVLELPDVYDDARHEFQAVEVAADVRHPPDGTAAWRRDMQGLAQELNPPYKETFEEGDGWQLAPHHRHSAVGFVAPGRDWEALAVWSLLRDRWNTSTLRHLLGRNEVEPATGSRP